MCCRPLLTENDVDVPELSAAVLRKVLIKCVAIILSHTGFESKHFKVLIISSFLFIKYSSAVLSAKVSTYSVT